MTTIATTEKPKLTPEQVAAAVKQHATAKAMKAQAEEFEKTARQTILDYHEQNPADFMLDPNSKTGRTFFIVRDGFKSTVTFPEAQPTPAHFDSGKTEDFRHKLVDAWGEDEAYTYFSVSYTFREQRWFEDMKDAAADKKLTMNSLIEGFVVPEQPGAAQSPRVSSGEAGRTKGK